MGSHGAELKWEVEDALQIHRLKRHLAIAICTMEVLKGVKDLNMYQPLRKPQIICIYIYIHI